MKGINLKNMHPVNKFFRDFISKEKRTYNFQIGKILASSLAGFVAGALVATAILVTGFIIFNSGIVF